MQQQNRPTTGELLVSWQLIWTRKLSGKPAEVKEAIERHAKLFPSGNQAEALQRTERTVKAFSGDPNGIRALIQRGKATLRRI